MGHLAERYSHEQREGAALAYLDHGMRPARLVREALKAGKITFNGAAVPAVDMPESTILTNVTRIKNRRAGKVESELAKLPARDQAEALKRALANMADQEIRAEQRKKVGKRDPEKIRQLARAAREIAAIPDRADSNPRSPGKRDTETGKMENGGQTEGGLAGAILSAAGQGATRPRSNAGQAPAQDVPHKQGRNTETEGARAHEQGAEQHERTNEQEGPGSWASTQARVLEGAA